MSARDAGPLQSPNLEKGLTFPDDSLLESTSNAVERANRRHRKMQKTVYRVRTQPTISGRIALDMFHDVQGPPPHGNDEDTSSRQATIIPCGDAKVSRESGFLLLTFLPLR